MLEHDGYDPVDIDRCTPGPDALMWLVLSLLAAAVTLAVAIAAS